MMKRFMRALLCLLMLVIYSFPAFGQGNTISVNNSEEIAGCWKRINFTPAEMKKLNQVEAWPLKYQWFCFYPNGDLKTIMTTKGENPTARDLKKALDILPSAIQYSIPQKGIIYTEHKQANEKLYWVSAFFPQDVQIGSQKIKKGTLLMTLRNSSGKDVYYRFLERIK